MSGSVLRIASLAALCLAGGAQPAGAGTTIKGVFKAVVTVVTPVAMPLQTPISFIISTS